MKTVEVPCDELFKFSPDKWVSLPPPEQWLKYNNVYIYNQDAYDAWLESIGEKAPKPLEIIETKPGKCDCGSAAAGSSRHSTWCSAYEK